MPKTDILTHVLSCAARAESLPDAASWWRTDRAVRQQWSRPTEASIAGGFAADRIAWAFASAYQSALRTLRPQLPADAPASFCVSEAGGSAPKDIRALARVAGSGVQLDGAKSWINAGPEHTVLLVLARFDETKDGAATRSPADERPRLCVLQIDSRMPGVTLTPIIHPSRVPELPQATGRFDAVVLPATALLEGDGYRDFVRPFRTLEAVQVNVAVTAMLLREGRSRGWHRDLLERAMALLAALLTIAEANPLAASTDIALAGALDGAVHLYAEADSRFDSQPDEFVTRWQRDRPLLKGMTASRTQRAERAWQRLDAGPS